MMSTLTHERPMEIVVTTDGVDPSPSDVSTERASSCRYESDTGSYRARFDTDSHRPSEAVVDLVAGIEAADPVELPPLFHAVDPDALDSLVSSAEDEESFSLSFAYDGHDVTVTA